MGWQKIKFLLFAAKAFGFFMVLSFLSFKYGVVYDQTIASSSKIILKKIETPFIRGKVVSAGSPVVVELSIPLKERFVAGIPPTYQWSFSLFYSLILASSFLSAFRKVAHLFVGTLLLLGGALSQLLFAWLYIYSKLPLGSETISFALNGIASILLTFNMHFGALVLPLLYWLALYPIGKSLEEQQPIA